jgi:hypothetical protein
MNAMTMRCRAVFLACLPAASVAFANEPVVTVTPEESNEILANPGMGWETFHCTARQDKTLPEWIPSTVQYVRWTWGRLEPQPERIDSDFLDTVLKASHDSGQKLAFRVMCCSTDQGQPYHPKWLRQVGGRELSCTHDGRGPLPVPDLDDPIVLNRHLDFIKRLGKRYDGHPDLDHVDLGSVGWWGEWHMSRSACRLPKVENCKRVVDAYLTAFKKTPLLMLIGGGECLTYATQHGTGWRADCLGDMGGFSNTWCHMRQGYPGWFRQSRLQEIWKTAPVAWETCWDMRKWMEEGWSLRYIFNYALACHASYINNKSAPLPEGSEVRPELERFLRRLGYRLVLKQLSHAASVKAGDELQLSMKWQNAGSAPCYRPYHLAYRLGNAGGTAKIIVSKVAVNRWLPGSVEVFTNDFLQNPEDLPPGDVVEVSDAFVLPADLPAGRYRLSLAIVGEDQKPAVRLAIRGRAEDGWYPISEVNVPK